MVQKKRLGQPPQQLLKAIWKHLNFGGRPQGSLGAPRFIQGGHDSEKYTFSGVGFGVILIGLEGSDQALPGRSQNGDFSKWSKKAPGAGTAAII